MYGLLRFELYKIFHQKAIYVLGIILFGYLTALIVLNMPSEAYDKYKPFEGDLSERFADESGIPTQLQDRIVNIKAIHQSIDNRIDTLNEALIGSQNVNDDYRKKQLEKGLLSGIGSPVFYDDRGITNLIDNSREIAIIIAAFITFSLAGIFTIERTTGVNQLILGSKKGRKQIVTAKIIAAAIFVVSVFVLVNGYSLFLTKLVYGSLGWDSLLQYHALFHESPYPFTLGTYYLLRCAIQFIGAISLALFILLVSTLSRNSFISFFISGFVYTYFVILDFDSAVIAFPFFNYYKMMSVNGLFMEYQTLNIVGYPLLYPLAAIILIVLLSLVMIKIIYHVHKRKEIEYR